MQISYSLISYFETQSKICRTILERGLVMKHILGSFLIVFTAFSIMTRYTFPQESSQSSMEKAQIKIISMNHAMMRTRDYDQAFEAFIKHMRQFLQQAADSEYALTVQQLLEKMEETLASGDFKVAQFYAERGNHAGAILRLKKIMDNYPGFSHIDEVTQLYKALSPTK
jgi:outer membrane protein assembly factor BamD (BamD/ComL family)